MKRKIISLLTVFFILSMCSIWACKENKPIEPPPQNIQLFGIENGFEEENTEKLITGKKGVSVSRSNLKAKYGSYSTKLDMTYTPWEIFKFENVKTPNVSDYDYLSFWIYNDHKNELSFVNKMITYGDVGTNGTKESVELAGGYLQSKQWTRIKLTKEIAKDYLSNINDGEFVLTGVGEEVNKSLEYSVYIDGIMLYKDGMDYELECNYTAEDGVTEEEYTLPVPTFINPKGVEEQVDYSVNVTDSKGNNISVKDNKFTVLKEDEIDISITAKHKNLTNIYNKSISIKAFNADVDFMALGLKDEPYELNLPMVKHPKTLEVIDNSSAKITVTNEGGDAISVSNNKFTPNKEGVYKIKYEITARNNTKSIEKTVRISRQEGLISEFEQNELNMFSIKGNENSSFKISNDSRYSKNGKSLCFETSNESYPSFKFNENFPIRSLDIKGERNELGHEYYDYMSMWFYSTSANPIGLAYQGLNTENIFGTEGLAPKTWTRIVLGYPRHNSGLKDIWQDNSPLKKYDLTKDCFYAFGLDKQSGQNISFKLYIDDIRLYRNSTYQPNVNENYPEEVDFAKQMTGTQNSEYKIDDSIFKVGFKTQTHTVSDPQPGNLIENVKATVKSVISPSKEKITIVNNKFTPLEPGEYIFEFECNYKGVKSSKKTMVNILAYMQIVDINLVSGEVDKSYKFRYPQCIIGDEEVDESNISLEVKNPSNQTVEISNKSFTPNITGIYTATFIISKNNESLSKTFEFAISEKGKTGLIANFEDETCNEYVVIQPYFYGVVNSEISNDVAHSGNSSIKLTGKDAPWPQIGINGKSPITDISSFVKFSFWMYVDYTPTSDDDLNDIKVEVVKGYYNDYWGSDIQAQGSLNKTILPADFKKWVEISIDASDYEKVLGGTKFTGNYTGNIDNNATITPFQISFRDKNAPAQYYGARPMNANIKYYFDDFKAYTEDMVEHRFDLLNLDNGGDEVEYTIQTNKYFNEGIEKDVNIKIKVVDKDNTIVELFSNKFIPSISKSPYKIAYSVMNDEIAIYSKTYLLEIKKAISIEDNKFTYSDNSNLVLNNDTATTTFIELNKKVVYKNGNLIDYSGTVLDNAATMELEQIDDNGDLISIISTQNGEFTLAEKGNYKATVSFNYLSKEYTKTYEFVAVENSKQVTFDNNTTFNSEDVFDLWKLWGTANYVTDIVKTDCYQITTQSFYPNINVNNSNINDLSLFQYIKLSIYIDGNLDNYVLDNAHSGALIGKVNNKTNTNIYITYSQFKTLLGNTQAQLDAYPNSTSAELNVDGLDLSKFKLRIHSSVSNEVFRGTITINDICGYIK